MIDKRHLDKETGIVNRFIEYKDFIKDKQVEFVIKKTERLVYVAYLLSGFVPQKEVLHGDIKRTSHALLRSVSQFPQSTGVQPSVVDQIHAHLQYLSALLSLACISGYVSESNVELFKGEINYLHKHVEELSTKSVSDSQQMQLRQDVFVVGQAKQSRVRSEEPQPIKDNPVRQPRDLSLIKDKKAPASKRLTPVSESKEIIKPDREERILQVIRDKRIVSIKDISSVVFDCSEKTIQRTLQTLIDKGQLRKEGERRWAKYSLV
jgi:hypothetical protein